MLNWNDKYTDFVKVSRKEARKIGQRYYWPDHPCTKGHHTWRSVVRCACVQCRKEQQTKNNYQHTDQDYRNTEARRKVEIMKEEKELMYNLGELL